MERDSQDQRKLRAEEVRTPVSRRARYRLSVGEEVVSRVGMTRVGIVPTSTRVNTRGRGSGHAGIYRAY